VDQMMIVTAPELPLLPGLIDSYLVAAEILGISPLIILNKIDLLNSQVRSRDIQEYLQLYRKINYPVLFISVNQQKGLEEVAGYLKHKTSVFVGQSGVGKSALTSNFLPHEGIKVGALADSGLGSHTTTMARLYHLPLGGNLIDSPGIREFGLWNMQKNEIEHGFREFQPYLGQCKFRNCRHDSEPHCAIKNALGRGEISPLRLESFHELVKLYC
jgi:ribosome biogenesis GTPase / thiamine phosphate phosphatase